jgi:hypothetical protein
MAQPANGPHLAPSRFFFLGFLKRQIQGVHFPERETLKSTICRIFGELDGEVLISVFLDWTERLERVIENEGEHSNS